MRKFGSTHSYIYTCSQKSHGGGPNFSYNEMRAIGPGNTLL